MHCRPHSLSTFLPFILVIIRRWWRNGTRDGRSASRGAAAENGAGWEEEVELGFPHLKEVLRVQLNVGRAGEVVHVLDEAAVLAEHLEREAPAREVVEDARVAAGDVHAAAKRAEVHVHAVVGLHQRRGRGVLATAAAVAAEDDGVGLHVVLEALALQLREPHLKLRRRGGGAGRIPHVGARGIGIGPFVGDQGRGVPPADCTEIKYPAGGERAGDFR